MAGPIRREIARDFLYLSSVRVVSLAIGFLRSLFIPRLLGPTFYGFWKTLGIIQSYIQFADLGAIAALKREVPLHRQRGDEARLREVRDVAFFVNHVVLFLGAASILAASFIVDDPAYRRGLRLFLVLMYAIHIHTFLEQYLYWRKEFARASRINLVLAVVEFILAVSGTYFFGLEGLILGTFLGYATAVLLQLRGIAFRLGFAFRWSAYVDLVKIGFPSHVNGLLYNLLMSVDRVMILPVLGLAALGFYGLAQTVNEYLFQFSYALGTAISPRLVERYGRSESIQALRPIVEKSTLAISVASPAVLGGVWFLAPALVEVVLPDFREAILPLRILLVGTFFSSLHRGLSSFFLTVRKQARLFPAYGGAIALNALLVWTSLAAGMGLRGVATATALTLAIFSITLIVMARWFFVRGVAAHLRFVLLLLAPLAWGAMAVWAGIQAAEAAGGSSRPIISAVAGAALFAALYAPALYVAYRRLGGGWTPQAGETPGA
jgi:O-antigen/teichoic acid export membrane protein